MLARAAGTRVYYPTVFSLYEKHVSIASEMQNAGLWREAGFGMVCVYRSDFQALGGFDKQIDGWGKEDVDLFDRMIRKFDVVRAVDDGIMHNWHDKVSERLPSVPIPASGAPVCLKYTADDECRTRVAPCAR